MRCPHRVPSRNRFKYQPWLHHFKPLCNGWVGNICYCDFDDFELGLFRVARHFWDGFTVQESCGWHRAYTVAVERRGEGLGFPVAHSLQRILWALRSCRLDVAMIRSPFAKSVRLTVANDESALLAMLHHLRRDETPQARLAFERLTDGRMDAKVIEASLWLSARFPHSKPSTHTGTKPTLQIVR